MKQVSSLKIVSPLVVFALLMLCFGALMGCLSGLEYVVPGYLRNYLGFEQMRPMHVSAVLFWILLGATVFVYAALNTLQPGILSGRWIKIQVVFWLLAITGVFYSYTQSHFGGREYWEFESVWALPIALSWLMFVVQLVKIIRKIKVWPVYVWMWMTGSVFFLWIFMENYFWVFTGLLDKAITDLTIQWKVNGSIVGAWNQLIYGTAFYLMDRIKSQTNIGSSKLAFAMYFLGLFNLMFNWGHHVYTLPGAHLVRYIGYVVSMTEWVFFAKILWEWRQSVREISSYYQQQAYKFLMASNIWVFFNMGMAILMSIPVLNLYTHGTHVTVAHAMGTTIGINTMILLAAAYAFAGQDQVLLSTKKQTRLFWVMQISLLVFVVALVGAGLTKGVWQIHGKDDAFRGMMLSLQPYFRTFVAAGFVVMVCLFLVAGDLLKQYLKIMKNQ